MKRILSILIIVVAATMGYSKTKIINADKILAADVTAPGSITCYYTGVASDTLTANQDTLIYNITLNKSTPMNTYARITLDTIAGADTTVIINLRGRMFNDESWTIIKSVTSTVIDSSVGVVIETMTAQNLAMGFKSDSTYSIIPSINPCWRQIQTELIISGDDLTGKGVKLKGIKWYFQESK